MLHYRLIFLVRDPGIFYRKWELLCRFTPRNDMRVFFSIQDRRKVKSVLMSLDIFNLNCIYWQII